MWGGGLLIFYVANVANVANVIKVHFIAFCDRLFRAKAVPLHRNSKTTAPCPGTQVVHPDLSGRPRLLKLHPRRNYWAYLPNNLPKNVVPLQRNFKTLQYHESPNIAVKGATQPKEIPPNCSFLLPLLR